MNFTLKIWRQKDAKAKGGFETYKGENEAPELTKEPLNFEFVHPAQRNYKD